MHAMTAPEVALAISVMTNSGFPNLHQDREQVREADH